jgi:hypothetical protein
MATLKKGTTEYDLGIVTSDSNTKVSGLFNIPVPFSDSTQSPLADLFGNSREINVTGTKTGTTAQMKTFIDTLDALVNGRQEQITYTDDLGVSFNGLLDRFTREIISPTKINYTLIIKQGKVIT